MKKTGQNAQTDEGVKVGDVIKGVTMEDAFGCGFFGNVFSVRTIERSAYGLVALKEFSKREITKVLHSILQRHLVNIMLKPGLYGETYFTEHVPTFALNADKLEEMVLIARDLQDVPDVNALLEERLKDNLEEEMTVIEGLIRSVNGELTQDDASEEDNPFALDGDVDLNGDFNEEAFFNTENVDMNEDAESMNADEQAEDDDVGSAFSWSEEIDEKRNEYARMMRKE